MHWAFSYSLYLSGTCHTLAGSEVSERKMLRDVKCLAPRAHNKSGKWGFEPHSKDSSDPVPTSTLACHPDIWAVGTWGAPRLMQAFCPMHGARAGPRPF